MMLPVPEAGVLTGVEGVEEARALPGVTEVDITIPPGTAVEPLPEGDRYLGFIFATAPTSEEVTATLRRAAVLIRVTIDGQ